MVILYACAFEKRILKPIEVFNFTQNDLLTEDIMVLDTHSEVFIWIGQRANSKLKEQFSFSFFFVYEILAIENQSKYKSGNSQYQYN